MKNPISFYTSIYLIDFQPHKLASLKIENNFLRSKTIFDSRTVHVRFALDKVALEHVFPVAYQGGGWGVQPPPPDILKAVQNRAKLNPTVKIVKIAEFRTHTPLYVRKKGSKIQNLPGFVWTN